MFRSLVASTGVALFAVVGCEDHLVFAEPAGEAQLVYVNGVPDHCIVGPAADGPTSPSLEDRRPAIAEGGR